MSIRHVVPRCTLAVAALAVAGSASAQSRGIIIESVNSYPTKGSLTNSIANGDGFYQSMTTSGSPWSLRTRYTDTSVYDTDFIDPDIFSNGGDTYNFDQNGAAIAYFTGHGPGDGGTGQTCNTWSDCVSPPGGTSLPADCRNIPGAGKTCVYTSPRYIVTESPGDKYGGWAGLTHGGGVGFGESTYSGAWAGAGTNGGVNLLVADQSFGVSPGLFWAQLGSAFAGVHLWATLMPTWGDTANVADRGPKFAAQFQANSAGSVAAAWVATLNSLGSEGMACNGSWSRGGGGGINGCGCNVVMSVDVDKGHSDAKINVESWNLLDLDVLDATGNGYMTYEWQCNYDSSTYGWWN